METSPTDALAATSEPSIRHRIVSVSAARVAALGIGFATSVIVARQLGPQGRGLLAVSSAIVAVGVQAGSLGLPGTNTYVAARAPRLARSLLANSASLALVVGLAAGLLGFGSWIAGWRPLPGEVLAATLVGVPVGVAFSCVQYLLLGLGKTSAFWAMDVMNRIALVLCVALVVVGGGGLTLLQAVSFSAAAVMGAAIFGAWAIVRTRRAEAVRPSLALYRENAGYGMRTYMMTACLYLVLRADVVVVNSKLSARDAGYYAAAVTLVEPIFALPSVVGTVLFGELSKLVDAPARWRVTRRAATWALAASVGGALVVVAIADRLIVFVYGEAFGPGAMGLRILAVAIVPFGLSSIASNHLSAGGLPRWAVAVWGGAAVANISGNLLLVERFGIEAAAAVSLVTYSGVAILLFVGARMSRAGSELSSAGS